MRAYADLRQALAHYRFWLLFGLHDAGAQFQRTAIGGFFHSLNVLLRVIVIYFIFRESFDPNDTHYFGYISIGLPIFTFYSASITQGYSILRKNRVIIENMSVPYFSFIFRFLVENIVRFGFSIFPFFVYLLYNIEIIESFSYLLIVGILVFLAMVVAMSVFSMVMSAFFPSLSEAINALMGIMFFATPVFWHPGDYAGVRGMLATYNPMSHMIAIIREPALGRMPTDLNLLVCFGILGALILAGWLLFEISRPWLIYRL